MHSPFDEVEEAIIELLNKNTSMRFTDLFESLDSKGIEITRPKLSRRLKNLVNLGVIIKETVSGWPPTTCYRMPTPEDVSTRNPGKKHSRIMAVLATIIGLLMISSYYEYRESSDLRTRLDKSFGDVGDLENRLLELEITLQNTKSSLEYSLTNLSITRDILSNTTNALNEKEKLTASLSNQIQLLEAQIQDLNSRQAVISYRPRTNSTEVQTFDIKIIIPNEPKTRTIPIP